MVEILDANDNLPVFEDRADLTVSLNEVGFYHQLMCMNRMNVFACMMWWLLSSFCPSRLL